MVDITVKEVEPIVTIASGLVRIRYDVELASLPEGKMTTAASSPNAAQLTVEVARGDSLLQKTIPIEIKDGAQLASVNSLDLATIGVHETRSRTIVISTIDGGHFAVGKFENVTGDSVSLMPVKRDLSSQNILTLVFNSEAPGIFTGTVRIIPDSANYNAVDISYRAEVVGDDT